ncbi:hypothetical protein K7W03_01015 [Sphingobium sp. PNB]|uniref:hypothetical protein n=1 Tax=Sphingobium sp. PNB TaxID=863934 RepID=UPI001CA3E337|nr:hypothetical protein [Sphingobium sp. PNB]MCB4858166.1 hypothetical protein [Sphingobium sp. PNB]
MSGAAKLLRASRKGAAAACMFAGSLSCPSGVVADVRPGLAMEGSLALADNPLLIAGPDRGAAVVDAGIRPAIEISDMTGLNVTLSGLLAGRHYSRRYEDVVHGNAQLAADWRKNEWLTLSALALFSREPLIDRLATDIDASVKSTGVREGRLGRLSMRWNPDSHTRIQPEMTFESGHYPGMATLRDTRSTIFALSAIRRTSAYTTLGTRWSYMRSSVDGASDSKVYSGYASLEQRLSAVWRLRMELGLEHVRTPALQSTPADGRSQAAGRIELCRDSPRLNLCASGALTSEVSGLGGLQRRIDIGAAAQWRLAPRLNLALDGRYQRATQQRTALPGLDAAQASLRLERRINRRITASAVAEYRRREPPGERALSSTTIGIQLKYEPLPL